MPQRSCRPLGRGVRCTPVAQSLSMLAPWDYLATRHVYLCIDTCTVRCTHITHAIMCPLWSLSNPDTQGVATMRKGEVANFTIAPHKAYGEAGSGAKIPPNSTLKFEIELL